MKIVIINESARNSYGILVALLIGGTLCLKSTEPLPPRSSIP